MRAFFAFTVLVGLAWTTLALAQVAQSDPPAQPSLAPPQAQASDVALEERVRAILQRQMRTCWRMPVEEPNPERLVVTVQFNLNADGSLNGQPRVTQPGNFAFDPPMQRAAEAALQAVRACSPYNFADDPLLSSRHDLWQEIEMRFAPRSTAFDLSIVNGLMSNSVLEGQRQAVRPPETIEEEVAYALRMHMAACRAPPARGEARMAVVLTFALNRDGTLRGRPHVDVPANYRRDRAQRAAVERAISDLRGCAPFPFASHPRLAERYDLWDSIRLRMRAPLASSEPR